MKLSIKNLTKALENRKGLVSNFSFVAILQFFQLFIAFISYPYLIRVLGKEVYGLIIFAQTIINYFVIIVNFGFKTIITYEIASNIKSITAISNIVSSTYAAKIILALSSFLVLVIMIIFIPLFHNYYLLYFLSFLFCLGEMLLPVWFFQAIEKMKYITFINVSVKLFFLSLIFLFVKDSKDYLLVPVFLGIGSIIGGAIGMIIMLRTQLSKEQNYIRLFIPQINDIKWIIKRSFSYFLSNIAATIKGKTSNIFLGIFLSYESVAIYDICFKVVNILNTVFSVFSTVLFPRVVKTKNISQLKKIFIVLFSLGLVMFFIVFITAEPIISLLGGQDFLQIGKKILRIMALALPFSGGIVVLGGLTLVGFKKDKYFTYGLLLTLLFYFIIIGGLLLFNLFTIVNVAIVYLLCILFEFSIHRINVKRFKIY